jgi:peptidase M28-like protein
MASLPTAGPDEMKNLLSESFLMRLTFRAHGLALFLLALVPDTGISQSRVHDPEDQVYYGGSRAVTPPTYPLSQVEDRLIRFPLPKGKEKYGSIDGRKLHRYVEDLAKISRRYRDAGHPKYWGRIRGTSADRETAEWLAAKFKGLGLTDVRLQPFDLKPQWMPESWDVLLTGGGKCIDLTSAQPAYGANALPLEGVDLDVVYVGLGTDADFLGREVKGKAVLISDMWGLADEVGFEAAQRADRLGASVILAASMMPGNMRYQHYGYATKPPVFVIGNDDGVAARQLIETAKDGTVKAEVTLAVSMVPKQTTSVVWGTLRGATNETIYVAAHRDGWFEAGTDNGSGVAQMLGLAEYFSGIPQAKRRRTLIFLGLDGHHNGDIGEGRPWFKAHEAELFSQTALIINSEHPAAIQMEPRRPWDTINKSVDWSNAVQPLQWNFGGKVNPKLQQLAWSAFKTFGMPLELEPSGPLSDMAADYIDKEPVIEVINEGPLFHTDWDTPEEVPYTALEASTRAHAMLIDDVNELSLATLRAPYTSQAAH